jgi:tRNA-2-methylthio-N6-dimethylallyladenosine synthase
VIGALYLETRLRPAQSFSDQVPTLVALADQVAWDENKALVGQTLELMVAEGEGRKDAATLRLSGRGPDNRLVHFEPDFSAVDATEVRPGDLVTVEVTYAAPHHLVADGPVLAVRRTRSGDAWEARTAAPTAPSGVSLGMPTLGTPAPLPPAPVCG